MGAKPFMYVANTDFVKQIMVKQFGNFIDRVCIIIQMKQLLL